MSTDAGDRQQKNVREFLSILPLTIEIAGLHPAPVGTYLNEGQMDARALAIRTAYKIARQLIMEMAK